MSRFTSSKQKRPEGPIEGFLWAHSPEGRASIACGHIETARTHLREAAKCLDTELLRSDLHRDVLMEMDRMTEIQTLIQGAIGADQ